MRIIISRNGQQHGPYDIEDLNAYLKDGTFLPADLACQQGMDEWVPLNELDLPGLVVKLDESESSSEPSTIQEDWPKPSDPGDAIEKADVIEFSRANFFLKCIGVSILFALLTYWLLESAFRPPPVDDEPSWEWLGWAQVLEGDYTPRENGGPVYRFMAKVADEVNLDRGSGWFSFGGSLRDRGAVTMWMFFCVIVGIGIAIERIRSWKKRCPEDQAHVEQIISRSLLTKIKYAALILGLLILCFGIRNTMLANQRAKNIQFLLAVVKGNMDDINDRLSAGADVNVNRWTRNTGRKLLSEEDEGLLKGNAFGEGGISRGDTALHYASENGQTEVVTLLLSNGADVNAHDRRYGAATPKTPLDEANSNGHDEIAELLRKRGGKTGRELTND